MSKVILITGASSGFGAVSAKHLSGLGYHVYGTSRRAENPDAGAEFPIMLPMDVCSDASVAEAVAAVVQREGRLDVLVNNAGIGIAGPIEDTSVDEAQALFDTNFFGMHRVCRSVLPLMREQGSGLIINISSIGGQLTIPFQGFYSASKYAVEAFSEALRMEAAPLGIKVTIVEPGDFHTGFTEARVLAAGFDRDSPYYARGTAAIGVMEHDELNGADPLQLAELLARLVERDHPRLRYKTGMLAQRLAVVVKRILPDSLIEWALRSYYRV